MALDHPDCQVMFLNSDHCIASWHNVVIVIWNSAPDMTAIRKTGHLARYLSKKYPQGCLGLALCSNGMPLPSREIRKELGEWMRENRNLVKVNALVLDGAGFWASSVRAIITGLSAIVGHQTRKMFDDLTEAAAYLWPHFVTEAGTVQDLTVLVYQLQNEMLQVRDHSCYSAAK